MQTFLPYPSFVESAKALDMRRLGKQRVEAYQILRTLLGQSNGWRNHPAVKMWMGYEYALAEYGFTICGEWRFRGFKDSLMPKFYNFYASAPDYGYPGWLGNPEFHAAHRSNLLRKDAVFYGRYGWTEPPTLPYVWPV